jgi:hypothetical protein
MGEGKAFPLDSTAYARFHHTPFCEGAPRNAPADYDELPMIRVHRMG